MPSDLTFLVPGRLETRTGGYEYDRQIIEGLRARGWRVTVRELAGDFPAPDPAAIERAARALAAVPDDGMVLVDGLAFSALPEVMLGERDRLRLAALVHMPLAADTGLQTTETSGLEDNERRALRAARAVIATGQSTVDTLLAHGVAPSLITIVEPGTPAAPLAAGSGGSGIGSNAAPVALLSVAAITRGKGHEILLRALALVPHRAWHLTCAGSLDRDPATADRVRAVVNGEGLQRHVTFAGELDADALETCYHRADLFVLATLHETYGMAVAEALAHGLPVVSTTVGAIPSLVGAEAGLLVPPGEVQPFADATSRVLSDAAMRARLAEGARRVRSRLPTWEQASDRMAAVLEGVCR